jgi:hypothetical protein
VINRRLASAGRSVLPEDRKMKLLFTLIVVLSACVCSAQTAKVIQLSESDAAEAKSLYAQQKEIEAKIADLRYRITKNYLTASKEEEGHTNTYSDPRGGGWVWVKEGWGGGNYDFSEDFKFIVPHTSIPQSYGTYGNSSCPFFFTSPVNGGTGASAPLTAGPV